jgi:hypothetical protein
MPKTDVAPPGFIVFVESQRDVVALLAPPSGVTDSIHSLVRSAHVRDSMITSARCGNHGSCVL